jgi:FkbM family methyltransferase
VYEPETIKLLINREPEGDIVHAGTYFGDFVPALARSRVNGGVVWAFEPNPENVRCAKGTIHLNGLTNVVLTEGALDEVRGIGRLATYSLEGVPLGGGSHLVEGPNEGSGANARLIEVQLISIDEVVPASRRVVVIHLDVEGHEHKALIGAVQTITRCRPLLILETLPDRDLLASLGYVVTGSVHGNSVVAPM